MKIKSSKFLVTLFIPLIILLGMATKPVYTYIFGEEIVLETLPVDPTDLFYGDYVILNLNINEVPREKLSKDVLNELLTNQNSFYNGSFKNVTVYTSLEKNENVYTVKKVTMDKPEEGLYIKGKLEFFSDLNQEVYYIDYGLSRYYVEENTGVNIENQARTGEVNVVVKLANGYGLIQEILVNN